MNPNREYKSSVFSLLFGEENTLRGLYQTLEGVALLPNLPITINTLEDALFRTRLNDISIEAGDNLRLFQNFSFWGDKLRLSSFL
jgi:hypothetical protein